MANGRILAMLMLFAVISAAQNAPTNSAPPQGAVAKQQVTDLSSAKAKRSYALGMDLGRQLRLLSVEVDPEVFAKGLGDALAYSKTLLTDDEARAAIEQIQAIAKQNAEQAKRTGIDENKRAGDAFLADNKNKDGVVTLPSGLQYKVLKAGSGKKPSIDDTVVCHYRSSLLDGTEFDSSYRREHPASFPVKGVFKGWTEALQLMPVGSKWQLFVPSELAYGGRGMAPAVGPNATILLEVELISIEGKQ